MVLQQRNYSILYFRSGDSVVLQTVTYNKVVSQYKKFIWNQLDLDEDPKTSLITPDYCFHFKMALPKFMVEIFLASTNHFYRLVGLFCGINTEWVQSATTVKPSDLRLLMLVR